MQMEKDKKISFIGSCLQNGHVGHTAKCLSYLFVKLILHSCDYCESGILPNSSFLVESI
jgi:hypothetical protein